MALIVIPCGLLNQSRHDAIGKEASVQESFEKYSGQKVSLQLLIHIFARFVYSVEISVKNLFDT